MKPRIPRSDNLIQAALLHKGEKELGSEALKRTDAEVRRSGVKRVGRHIAVTLAGAGAVAGIVVVTGRAIDIQFPEDRPPATGFDSDEVRDEMQHETEVREGLNQEQGADPAGFELPPVAPEQIDVTPR